MPCTSLAGNCSTPAKSLLMTNLALDPVPAALPSGSPFLRPWMVLLFVVLVTLLTLLSLYLKEKGFRSPFH